MIIQSTSGLANRLRVIFSRIEPGQYCEVVWKPNKKCPGTFLGHFQPVAGVEFVDSPTGRVNYKGCQSDGEPDYSKLVPLPEVIESVQHNLDKLGAIFSAVHIRRTDHVKMAKNHMCFTPDEKFFEFIDQSKDSLFVACDCPETQARLYSRYPERMKALNTFSRPDSYRQTTLRCAIIDLYTCVYANRFMGSGYSSFSTLIRKLRELHWTE